MAFDFSEASDIIDNNSDELNNINEIEKMHMIYLIHCLIDHLLIKNDL